MLSALCGPRGILSSFDSGPDADIMVTLGRVVWMCGLWILLVSLGAGVRCVALGLTVLLRQQGFMAVWWTHLIQRCGGAHSIVHAFAPIITFTKIYQHFSRIF